MTARTARWAGLALAATTALALGVTGALPASAAPPAAPAPAAPAAPTPAAGAPAAAPAPLTNLAHLDFLLDQATPAPEEGHTSYRLDSEPTLTLPWT
ncbi:hypothetical protein [Frigoribacterium sp. NBH87]|uniref:hypothetical protein n=1 Tax=Frigoribacterium sp. NBH87 TaxID=2596916 RepID=UPI002106A9B0|nr:hypothetical protein [Frigoribacterium sp. NBH87]